MNPIWVQYWAEDAPHGHLVLLSDGLVPEVDIYGDIEGCAEELAKAFMKCNEDRHKGKGITHSQQEIEQAYRVAVFQLQTKDFAADWADLNQKIAIFQKWGGHPPAAMLSYSPEDPKQETLMVLDKNGNPHWYNIDKKMLGDILPPPQEGLNAIKSKTGLGWLQKSTRQQRRRRRQM